MAIVPLYGRMLFRLLSSVCSKNSKSDAHENPTRQKTPAIEIRSKNDYGKKAESKIADKIADYFEAGTLAIWDVDLKGDNPIRLHLADRPQSPIVFKYGEIAHAEPILPGWKFPVDDLSD